MKVKHFRIIMIYVGINIIIIINISVQAKLNDHLPMMTIAALSGAGGAVVLLLPDTISKSKETKK